MSEEKLYEFRRRWLPVYLVLLIALALVTVHLVVMYLFTRNTNYANLAVLSSLAAYFLYNGFQRLRRIKLTQSRILELVRCSQCGYSEERSHSAGDYVFKVKGVCPRCGGEMRVVAIYSVKLERGGGEQRAQRKSTSLTILMKKAGLNTARAHGGVERRSTIAMVPRTLLGGWCKPIRRGPVEGLAPAPETRVEAEKLLARPP